MEDALFDMNYLALNVGGAIALGSDVMTSEQCTVSTANQVTVKSTPIKIFGDFNCWYTKAGEDNWIKGTVNPTTKVVSINGAKVGDVYCVEYSVRNATAKEFTVSSAIVPSECYATLTTPIFNADSKSFTTSSQVGVIVVEIPRFLLSGAVDLSLSMSGASTTPLSGSALVTFGGSEGCSGKGYYAKIKQILDSGVWYEGLIDLAISTPVLKNGDIPKVYGLFNGYTTSIDNSLLDFKKGADVDTATTAIVLTEGKITGIASSDKVVTCSVKQVGSIPTPSHIAAIKGVSGGKAS